ncbi:MAG: methyltransferase domain-containing protein [Xanthomonadales bacterium]|nr:class I SAM-dependent methyltransferase [Xanthomonadales bacterium]NIX12099.1 methyltransferase domain-containing protein [Xanthomonadales bacterium]
MSLKRTQKVWETYGATDPLFGVLSDKSKRGGAWDEAEFFATGRADIEEALAYLDSIGVALNKGSALDFGCGVGRLTQALGDQFREVTGVDISAPMVENARRYNRHGEHCRYFVNTEQNLALFDAPSFDFIYTDKVLQHMNPRAAESYITEFFRILKPGGIALFQVPSGRRVEPGSLGEAWYNFRKGPLRAAWKRVRGMQPVEMHHIHHSRVAEIIEAAGGVLVAKRQWGSVRRSRTSFQYCAAPGG